MTYELRHYDIVCGSVNDVYVFGNIDVETSENTYNAGTDQEFTENEASNSQIMSALKACNFLGKTVKESMLEFDGDDQVIYINNANNGEPFCELRIVE